MSTTPNTTTHYGSCTLCEASCGLTVEVKDNRIASIRPDPKDALSQGHICPKGVALQDVQHDPDRIRQPMRRQGDTWTPVSWEEALGEISARLAGIQAEQGRDAVGLYVGNPTGHSYSAALTALLLVECLGSRSLFSSGSVDGLPRLLAALKVYGGQATLPIPDIDRTDFMLILGANPAVSNGSIMTAPGCSRRLKAIRARGGQIVVIDPRRTETAKLASAHHFIHPGTDVFLLLALLQTIFEEDLADPGRLGPMLKELEVLKQVVGPYDPDTVAPVTGIEAERIRSLARDFAQAPSAVCYGRMGVCTSGFGAVVSWLIDALNVVTGNLDRAGGAMFTTPAMDLPGIASLLGQNGSFNTHQSRVSGLPEFNRELPVAALAEEIETEGRGQVRALITHAGNPVLSLPNGKRLDRALSGLDFMVSIDIYRNETTRHADFILPPTFGFEHDEYPVIFLGLAVRNFARYTPAFLTPPPGVRHSWEILLDLATGLMKHRGGGQALLGRGLGWLVRKAKPVSFLKLMLRLGPHGKGLLPGGRGLSWSELKEATHGVDLGPLQPRLPEALRTPDKKIHLAPEVMLKDMRRVQERLEAERAQQEGAPPGALRLITRRALRSNNSWMHNSPRLVRGKDRCTLQMHPSDAGRLGIEDQAPVSVSTPVASIQVPVRLTDQMMPGVVSLPHGWGHDREGSGLTIAAAHPGASFNDLLDDKDIDEASGCSTLNGIRVTVAPVAVTARSSAGGSL